MMIAKSWMKDSAKSQAVSTRLPFPNFGSKLPENSGEVLPSRRDREVPYGMKGGERNGCEEKAG
jgi:hypothetical protein